jgi:hypothetical protein
MARLLRGWQASPRSGTARALPGEAGPDAGLAQAGCGSSTLPAGVAVSTRSSTRRASCRGRSGRPASVAAKHIRAWSGPARPTPSGCRSRAGPARGAGPRRRSRAAPGPRVRNRPSLIAVGRRPPRGGRRWPAPSPRRLPFAARAGGTAPRQAFGHGAERLEGLRRRSIRPGRPSGRPPRRLMPSASEPGASRRKRSTASSSGAFSGASDCTRTCGHPHVTGALVAMVVDLQVVALLAADLEAVALPRAQPAAGAESLRRGAQRRPGPGRRWRARTARATASMSVPLTALLVIARAWPARPAEQVGADEAAAGRRRRDDHRDLVRELVGQRLLDQQRMPREQRAVARQLLASPPCRYAPRGRLSASASLRRDVGLAGRFDRRACEAPRPP